MSLFEITQSERNRWQCRAAAELTQILQGHRDLPRIAWTVGPAGCNLAGHVNGLAPAATVRAAFDAWRAALALGEHAETASRGGGVVYLRAAACREGVRIGLTATVLDDGDGER